MLFTNIVCADDAFDHGFTYLDLPHQASSYFLYFIFGFGKESFSSFDLLFLGIQVQGTLILFLLVLFGFRV